MRYHWFTVCGLACLAAAQCLSAASLIEETDGESTSLLYVEGGKLRVEEAGSGNYAVIDPGNRSFVMVNPADRTAVDMSANVWGAQAGGAPAAAASVEARLEKVGAGPAIAGYETMHFTLLANGKPCQDLYVSRQAFEDAGLATLWAGGGNALREMHVDPSDPCDLAEQKALDYEEHGLPLKTVHRESMHAGQFEEVKRIEKDVPAPAGGFGVPTGYQMISLEAMMGAYMQEDTDEDDSWGEEDYGDEEYRDEAWDEESSEGEDQ